MKPIRVRLKTFFLCESSSGYAINWRLYTGEVSNGSHGATYNTVMSLCESLEGENHILYMDRFYITPQLLNDLKNLSIAVCGTVQVNRLQLTAETQDFISTLDDKEIIWYEIPQDLLLCVWKDHKMVYLLSNFHSIKEVTTERVLSKKDYKKQSQTQDFESEGPYPKEKIRIPSSVFDYNKGMRGVDVLDQLSSYYGVQLVSKRWYIKVFFQLEIAMINSYILYKKTCVKAGKAELPHLQFRLEVIRSLLHDLRITRGIPTTPPTERKNKRKVSIEMAYDIKNDCVLEEIPVCGKKSYTREYYSICRAEGSNGQSRYQCGLCQVAVCFLACYDKHRSIARPVKRSK